MTEADQRQGTWPELMYRLIEHYKWEPQHLEGTVEEFDARIRRQEVPLNFMLNLLLRCSSTGTIATMFEAFQPFPNAPADVELKFPWETKLVQPDVRLESSTARIFIEVKVDAAIKIDQVRKYLLLHQEMDARFGKKEPYVFFLTKRKFRKSWKPATDVAKFSDVSGFLMHQLRTTDLFDSNIYHEVRFAASDWTSVAAALTEALHKLGGGEAVEGRIIGDFLSDLHLRGLVN